VQPELVHESAYYVVERLFVDDIVRITRRDRPFGSEWEVDHACGPVQATLDRLGRDGRALLIDSRAISGRNDPTSEKQFAVHRRAMIQGFRRVAVLNATATGKLHTQRLLRADGTDPVTRVFLSEQEAILYLMDG
jgi:uncharacterized membrane protein YccC